MLKERLLPVEKGSGFSLPDKHVWCGSCMRDADGRYNLFASCWPFETSFPDGYMHYSHIVQAVTDDLSKPFTYLRTITDKRDGGFWDSTMQHNPYIVKAGEKYVLYYIGSPDGNWRTRAIGYAVADSLTGEFVRSDTAIRLPENANNPAVWVNDDESIAMAFRDGELRLKVAMASRYDGEYTVICEDAFPGIKLEDPFLWRDKAGVYHIVLEDNVGGLTGHERFGAHILSEDLVSWRKADPVCAYDHTLRYTDGTQEEASRRERPFYLIENGEMKALFNGWIAGPKARNCVVPMR